MASIRRTLSPVPRQGAQLNGEAYQVASPLSKSSSNIQNSALLPSSLGSLDYALYKVQNVLLGLFSQRSSRPFDRSKLKGQIWRRAFLHFLMCFIVGVLVGLTPLVPLNLSMNVPKHETFNFKLVQTASKELYSGRKDEISVVERFSMNGSSTLVPDRGHVELKNGTVEGAGLNNSMDVVLDLVLAKLLIIVTPMHPSPLQAFYLHRLAHSLNLVTHPLLWIVVEMNSQSAETAEILRNTGIMHRHLVCSTENSTDETAERNMLLRNAALSHIEKHRLDGVVYFADADKIYSTELFDLMRQISRFGTWMVAKVVESEHKVLLEGPVCNGSRVMGWHLVDTAKRSRRFHTEMSGFAFNSTIIWDPKRWRRPTIEPVRLLETVKELLQASTFIEQIIEDESQMECLSTESSRIFVWHHHMDPRNSNELSLVGIGTNIPI